MRPLKSTDRVRWTNYDPALFRKKVDNVAQCNHCIWSNILIDFENNIGKRWKVYTEQVIIVVFVVVNLFISFIVALLIRNF